MSINYKFILIGNSGVGKTSIFRKLSTGEFHEKNISTIGIEKKSLDVSIEIDKDGKTEKKTFNISFFDTAGQEKFRAVTLSYYKETDGILLLYDITDRKSFDNVSIWVNSIKEAIEGNESKYAIILIGNKLDLVEEEKKERQVTEEEAKEACETYKMIWGGERSTKTIKFEELNELFAEYVKEVYKKVGIKVTGKQTSKKIGNYKKKKKGCLGIF
jgi:small GTP-binding protein